MKKNILVVAAHPDDEILGCGGTMARLRKEGNEIFTLLLGEGVASRCAGKDTLCLQPKIKTLKLQAEKANMIIGVGKGRIFRYAFPDNSFDSVALLDIVKAVEDVIAKVKPHTIFTHFRGDLNIDHRIAYEAVITATRPYPKQGVKEIYSFEVLSSTEYRYPLRFSPQVFVDISSYLPVKLKAMAAYSLELQPSSYPRSLRGVRLNAEYWGMRTGMRYAEAFEAVRVLK